MLFQDALRARLDIIKPSESDFKNCHAAHPPRFTPGVTKLISRLQARGVHVYLVSGGFRQVRTNLHLETVRRKCHWVV
jgi:phosphoserine phosphatase